MFLSSRLALSRVHHWSLLQCPVINQCVASMRVHYSCPPPTPTSTTHTPPPLGHSIGVVLWTVLFFFVVYVCSFCFCLPSCTNTMIHWQLLLHSAIVIIHHTVVGPSRGSGYTGLDLWYCSSPRCDLYLFSVMSASDT